MILLQRANEEAPADKPKELLHAVFLMHHWMSALPSSRTPMLAPLGWRAGSVKDLDVLSKCALGDLVLLKHQRDLALCGWD